MFSYKNGNYTVTIEEDGTKTRYISPNREPLPEFPESVDLKITNKCDLNCAFCYECSCPDGVDAKFTDIVIATNNIPEGVEIAIGGGNPLYYQRLPELLKFFKSKHLIANITVNERHLTPHYEDLLQAFIDDKLIYGIGVSLSNGWKKPTFLLENAHIVAHVIAGIHTPEVIDRIRAHYNKVLILGYKEYGRGKKYYSVVERNKIKCLKNNLWKLFHKRHGTGIISFDNRAIEQLEVWKHLTPKYWSKFYMGDDGKFTCYYNAISNTIKKNSTETDGAIVLDIVNGFKLLQGI